ncbi:MAG: Membrane dipeptidase [Sphingomonas bacterium]|nr:dipeptidase [Sphingomonas bacterium]MDB5690221.1 Membrane dipeptidase [Sphingomonas bacterium]
MRSGIVHLLLAGGALLAHGAPAQSAPAVSRAAKAVHNRLLTLDTHLDTPANFARNGWDFAARHDALKDFAQVDLPRMKAGGLDGGFFAIYTPQGPRTPEGNAAARDSALLRATAIREMAARLHDRVELAFTAADAARIAASGKTIVYQSMENAYPLEGDLGLLATFQKLGVRMVGAAHFLNNDFADSATDPKGAEWGGLSPLGRRLVQDANRLGLVLDASHSSDAVLDQMLALSATPIILSHSGCRAVYDHPRNVDDARLKALAAKGGVIQMNAYGNYLADIPANPERDAAMKALNARYGDRDALTPERTAAYIAEREALLARYPGSERTFDQFMAHMLHALKLVGPDHVGIGLDWDGGGGVAGMEDVSAVPRITEALLKAGYSEADLAKIWSGNVLRLLSAAEAAASPPAAAGAGG